MSILDKSGKEILFFDGAMGTALQAVWDSKGRSGEFLNIEQPEIIKQIHTDYLNAGCDIVTTNTFGANPFKAECGEHELEDICAAAIKIAKEAAAEFENKYVAFDIGPSGKLLEPLGDLSFDDCYEGFKVVSEYAEKYGADFILIETMSDTLEAKAAVLAAKENTN